MVTLTSNAATGWVFDSWSGDLTGAVDPDDITIDGNKTVTANFAEENIITFIELGGWNNTGCNPDSNPKYIHIESNPYGISGMIELQWLTAGTPNLKSVHFFANIDDGDVVTYEYTIDMNGLIFDGPFTLGGGYVSSDCIVIPGAINSPPEYPTHFYIKISVNGVNTYTIHIW